MATLWGTGYELGKVEKDIEVKFPKNSFLVEWFFPLVSNCTRIIYQHRKGEKIAIDCSLCHS